MNLNKSLSFLGQLIKRGISFLKLLAVLAVLVVQEKAALADVDWPTIGFTRVVTNQFLPSSIAHAGDGRGLLFIGDLTGLIWIIQSNAVLPQPFLDITNRVQRGAEQGLLSIAFPPSFETKNYFYVCYTATNIGTVTVSRFHVSSDPNVADATSEEVILTMPFPSNIHNAGQIAFGPDGYLYISVGDGTETDVHNFAQDLTSLRGKILRIDVESGVKPYAIPPANPFVGLAGAAPEIWAYGLRNPWRFSFDRLTGDLYIGDVGQDSYEEVDFQPAGSPGGQNYGWRIMEGPSNYNVPPTFTNFSSLTAPVVSYNHYLISKTSESGCVIGGDVCRDPSQPRMAGMYFYADWAIGWLWGLKRDGTNWQSRALLNPPYGTKRIEFVTLGEDDDGLLYFADYSGGIYQIQDTGVVLDPVFSPVGATNDGANVVAPAYWTNAFVSCPSPGATIHFTTNGLDPTEADPIVTNSFPVVLHVTNKARAYRADLSPSQVVTAVYTKFQAASPVFDPGGAGVAIVVTNPTTISISSLTPGAKIYYTTNGTSATTNSALYTGPITIAPSVTVYAIATAPGLSDSLGSAIRYAAAQTETPVFTPSSPITNGTAVTIFCRTPGSIIYYTTDGTTPTSSSATYSTPVSINAGTTLKSFAVATGYTDSAVQSTLYQLAQTARPVFSPATGPITNDTPVAISCATPESTIFYTLDGNTPTTNSTIYTEAIPMPGNGTLKAFATNSAYANSAVASTYYAQFAAPMFVYTPITTNVVIGDAVTLFSSANGVPYPAYQWQKDGTNIVGATNVSLSISHVQLLDAGTYTMVASNSVGTATASGSLFVWPDSSARLGPAYISNGLFVLQVAGLTNRLYRIESTTNLYNPITWSPVYTNTVSFWYTNTVADGQRFYRAVTNQ